MQKLTPLPWSPVQAPKVEAAKRPSISLGAIHALDTLRNRERELLQLNLRRAIGGIAVLAVLCTAIPIFVGWFVRNSANLHVDSQPPQDLISLALPIEGVLLFATLFVAILTSTKSRSDAVNQFLDTGTHSSGSSDNPLLRLALVVIMLGLLWRIPCHRRHQVSRD